MDRGYSLDNLQQIANILLRLGNERRIKTLARRVRQVVREFQECRLFNGVELNALKFFVGAFAARIIKFKECFEHFPCDIGNMILPCNGTIRAKVIQLLE